MRNKNNFLKPFVSFISISLVFLLVASCSTTKKAVVKKSPTPAVKKVPKPSTLVKTIEGFNNPESVVRDSHAIYVSNLGLEVSPSGKDSDGYISKLSLSGDILEKKFLPKEGNAPLHSPKGMAIIGNMLYVTDISSVVGYNLETRERTATISLASDSVLFLNDLTVKDRHTLIASTTDKDCLYEISIVMGTARILPAGPMNGPNGIWYNPKSKILTFNEIGKKFEGGIIYAYDTEKETTKILSKKHGVYDGIYALDASQTKFIVSDWGKEESGSLYEIDSDQGSAKLIAENLTTPADFYYDSETRKVWVPQLKRNVVTIHKIR